MQARSKREQLLNKTNYFSYPAFVNCFVVDAIISCMQSIYSSYDTKLILAYRDLTIVLMKKVLVNGGVVKGRALPASEFRLTMATHLASGATDGLRV